MMARELMKKAKSKVLQTTEDVFFKTIDIVRRETNKAEKLIRESSSLMADSNFNNLPSGIESLRESINTSLR